VAILSHASTVDGMNINNHKLHTDQSPLSYSVCTQIKSY